MARKLKVYRTTAGGFFELAVAAPSMKAAAEAWGADPDVFKRGFAEETDDPKAVEAAMAVPGTVLRRPVGSGGAFSEHAALPKAPEETRKGSGLHTDRAGAGKEPAAKADKRARQAADRDQEREKQAAAVERERKKQAAAHEREQKEQAAALEKERQRRALEEKKKEAERERARQQRERMTAKAHAAFEKVRTRHDEAMEALGQRREELDREEARENERWAADQRRHEEILRELERRFGAAGR